MALRRPTLSIPTRMLLGLAIVLVAFGGVSVMSLVQHRRTAATLKLLNEGYLPLAITVGDVTARQGLVGILLQNVITADPVASRLQLNVARRARPVALRQALERIARAEALDSTSEDRALLVRTRAHLAEVQRGWDESNVRYTDLFDARSSGDARRAEDVLADLAAEERAVDSELRGARRLLQERIEIVSSTAAEQERQAAILLMALTALALLVGVVVLWLAYRMLSPLPRLQRRVAVVARGDLSPAATLRSNDELGRLSEAFEEMVAALATRDVRLREAAEAELRLKRVQEQIVANLSAAVLVVDADGVVRTANPAAHRVLGLPRDAVGGRLDALGLLSKLPALRDAMERVDAGAERAVLEAVSVGPSTDQSVNVLVTPFVPDDPSEARGALVVAEDVTEELRTKARLIHTERLAAIGRMAAHVTHEVRNPLSSIGLNVEMLEDEVGNSPESKALLRAIQREIDRLTSITEEYLRLARLPQPRLEPESIGELVASVASFVAREMEGSGVELRVEVEEGLPAVALDEAQVRQAFLNLLRNARESMPGGGSVEVSATRAAGGVAVCVRDHGAGIDPAVREHIFDLFYTTKERGTGLGLPLTQQIVVAHGGTIECVGEPEGGTTFHLWFPQASEARSPGQGESIGGSVHEDLILDAE